MEALIKIGSTEFDQELFEKIKAFLKNDYTLEVTISIKKKEDNVHNIAKESEEEYWTRLRKGVKEIAEGEKAVFSMQELEEYLTKHT